MDTKKRTPIVVWWVLWAMVLAAIPSFYLTLGGKAAATSPSPSWYLGIAPLFISVFVRWITLPRIQTATAAFPLFLIGLAAAEATCFFGLFLFPSHKQVLFILSLLGVIQFIPFFAKRYS